MADVRRISKRLLTDGNWDFKLPQNPSISVRGSLPQYSKVFGNKMQISTRKQSSSFFLFCIWIAKSMYFYLWGALLPNPLLFLFCFGPNLLESTRMDGRNSISSNRVVAVKFNCGHCASQQTIINTRRRLKETLNLFTTVLLAISTYHRPFVLSRVPHEKLTTVWTTRHRHRDGWISICISTQAFVLLLRLHFLPFSTIPPPLTTDPIDLGCLSWIFGPPLRRRSSMLRTTRRGTMSVPPMYVN